MSEDTLVFLDVYESAVVRAGLADEHETESVSRLPSAFSISEAAICYLLYGCWGQGFSIK